MNRSTSNTSTLHKHFTFNMFRLLLILTAVCSASLSLQAQERAQEGANPLAQTLQDWANRLDKFGRSIPQEKVFIHMDNTCYFLGDTIWFKAYVTRTDTRTVSRLSELLYVELLNQDGFLVQRQNIRLKQGMGDGSFVLLDSLYGGYYELRAYTRWMLNWGEYEHPHTEYAEKWFFNKKMAKDYFRDYDKIYSRVFPVYDKPTAPGDYVHDMTLRPLARYFKHKEKAETAVLTLFPEGGNIVAGTQTCIAFEANNDEGKHLEGTVRLTDRSGNVVAEAKTEHRGRGKLTFACTADEKYTAEFSNDTVTAKQTLPEIQKDGCALRLQQNENSITAHVQAVGAATSEQIGLTVMHQGLLQHFFTLDTQSGQEQTVEIPLDSLPIGVNQFTVFNQEGRVYADRLCFVNRNTFANNQLEFEGIKENYAPFEAIQLKIKKPQQAVGGIVSVSVQDAVTTEYIYDDGNILTEMLLSSEIKGFVEQPKYYFEANDDTHRLHLDLLMMVQGWRRFSWQTMATPNAFLLKHPYEKTQYLQGSVQNYTSLQEEDELRPLTPEFAESELDNSLAQEQTTDAVNMDKTEYGDFNELTQTMRETNTNADRTSNPHDRFHEKESNLKKDVTVHAEFVQPGSPGVVGEMLTNTGTFAIQAPLFEDVCVFFLAAKDTTKISKKEKPYKWINGDEGDYPDFYVKLNPIYPNFPKPYSYYQQSLPPIPEGSPLKYTATEGERMLSAVTISARRGGKRNFLHLKPAFVLDAYEAFNRTCDLGLNTGKFIGRYRFSTDVARAYIGDMNDYRAYKLEIRIDGRNSSANMSPYAKDQYNKLYNLDKVYVYTDYCPRMEGSERYEGANQPEVIVDLRRVPNEGRRITYRDRRYVLPGFAVCEDFYHPNYSTKPLPDTQDYRRTLYWNPNVKLNENGEAEITLYNNAKTTRICVNAEGWSFKNQPLTGSSHPEDR